MNGSRPGETAAIAARIVGLEVEPRQPTEIDARWLMAYAAATGAHQSACFDTTAPDGPVAHPLFPVCYEWPLLLELRSRAIGEAAAPLSVHASHRLRLHRLPRAGDQLTSVARVTAVTARRSGALVAARLVTRDSRGALVSETDYGSLYRGVPVIDDRSAVASAPRADDRSAADGAPMTDGPRPDTAAADLPRPDSALGAPRWIDVVEVPYHFAHIYTECARIWNPIHTDLAVARAAGLPGPILHGTATLALAVSRIVERDLGGDCRAVRGIDARFTGMVALPSTFTVRAGARERHALAFDAVDGQGARVLGQGVLHL